MITLSCPECTHVFQVDEAKIPSATFSVKCPSCKKVFKATVHRETPPPPVTEKQADPAQVWEQLKPIVEDVVQSQMDSLRKEIQTKTAMGATVAQSTIAQFPDQVSKRALVCDSDMACAGQISSVLERLQFTVQICGSATEAFSRVDSNNYDFIALDLVFSDDAEGGQKLLNKINMLKPEQRRNMFVAVISEQTKTLGPQSAFFFGCNVALHKSELKRLPEFLQEGLHHYSELYRNFSELIFETKKGA